jgi:hypothetical protein
MLRMMGGTPDSSPDHSAHDHASRPATDHPA